MLFFVIAVALAQTPVSATPPSDLTTVKQDLRCLAAMSMLRELPLPDGNASDGAPPGLANVGGYGVLYYLGKVDGRAPGTAIANAMAAERNAIIADHSLEQDAKRCGLAMAHRMDEMGKQFRTLGK